MPNPNQVARAVEEAWPAQTDRPRVEPANDEVFPQEVYATAEPTWGRISPSGPEGEMFVPVLQANLDFIQGERRVAVYVLKEVKHLKIRRELV
jgi:hypothetical protein